MDVDYDEQHHNMSSNNKLIEHAQTYIKLTKRLKAILEDDSREYSHIHLLNDTIAYDKKYKLNGSLHKTINEGFDALNTTRTFNRKELDNYSKLLVSLIDVYSKNYRDCIANFVLKDLPEISKDTGDLIGAECWRYSKESITIIVFALKALFIEGGASLIRSIRSRAIPVLDASVDILSRSLCQRYPPEALGLSLEVKSEFFSFESEMRHFSDVLESLSQVPVGDVDAVYIELTNIVQSIRQHSKFIRSISGHNAASAAALDSSSDDEMVLSAEESSAINSSFAGADLSVVEYAVVTGAKSLCKLTITVLEDLMKFIKEQYQFDQNLCWNCYGTYWLEGIARVSRGVSDQIEELASVVTPPQRAELVVRSVRFLRVHIKALLDLASGHDQFQECEISSAKETFKSGHYWNHKMVRRLQTSFDTVMLQLYRMGI